jgi:hypothetical protein
MIEAHKKNSGSMRRASHVYLTQANVGEIAQLAPEKDIGSTFGGLALEPVSET